MITIEVCIGSACHLKGSYGVIQRFLKVINEKGLKNNIDLKAAFCLGKCTSAVTVRLNHEKFYSLQEDMVDSFIEEILKSGDCSESNKLYKS